MEIFKLFQNRRQVRHFLKDEYPDESLVKDLIDKTFEVVPSKQNLFPYSVKVIGPDPKNDTYRSELYELSKHTNTMQNTNCFAPYNLIFTSRLAFPIADWTVRSWKAGQPFDQFDIDKYKDSGALRFAAIEVGMFTSIFSALCLSHNINIGYMLCFPAEEEKWNKLDFIGDEVVYLVMSLGYRDHTKMIRSGEEKPEKDEVIEWI